MSDFASYLEITNNLGTNLTFTQFNSSEGDCCAYNGPNFIPADGEPHQIVYTDPCFSEGSEGVAYFSATVNGVTQTYAWYASCPVGNPANVASGPGILNYNSGGHPLTVTISVVPSTPPSSNSADPNALPLKDIKAALIGKTAVSQK